MGGSWTGDISGTDLWRNKGRIVHERFSQPPALENGTLRFTTESAMLTADGKRLASLTSRFALLEKRGAWHLTWEAAITPVTAGFYFGDQEERGLGVRVATGITEKNGGVITSSSGQTTAKATWGQPAAWCDYSGVINGKHVGVMIVPDPANPLPSWWHNRDYGVFVANPFGRQAMKQGPPSRIEVNKGDTIPNLPPCGANCSRRAGPLACPRVWFRRWWRGCWRRSLPIPPATGRRGNSPTCRP